MIFRMIGGIAQEHIKIEIEEENLKNLKKYVREYEIQFIDKNLLEIEVSDKGGIEYPDCITQSLPLVSDKMKRIFEENEINNIFYKPIFLIDNLLEEKHLYWLTVIPYIECFQEQSEKYIPEKIGNFKIFRDKNKDGNIIYVTEELKNILENKGLKGIYFYNIKE